MSFNDDLLAQPADVRKEVTDHELLHLKVPNHGKLFKALLKGPIWESTTRLDSDVEVGIA